MLLLLLLLSLLLLLHTVSFHNFKSQNFKLSVSNPKSKHVAYLFVLSQNSNCQSLGRKNKHEILKTDRRRGQYLSQQCPTKYNLNFIITTIITISIAIITIIIIAIMITIIIISSSIGSSRRHSWRRLA